MLLYSRKIKPNSKKFISESKKVKRDFIYLILISFLIFRVLGAIKQLICYFLRLFPASLVLLIRPKLLFCPYSPGKPKTAKLQILKLKRTFENWMFYINDVNVPNLQINILNLQGFFRALLQFRFIIFRL